MAKESPASIRPATQADKEALYRVHVGAIKVLARNAYTDDELRAWFGRLTPDSYTEVIDSRVMLVADAGGEIIGFCQLDLGTGEVEATLVDPRHANAGVGSTLLEAVEEIAHDRGLRTLHLASSLNAEAFYRKHGFEVTERSTFPFVKDIRIDCMMMTKRLVSGVD